MHIQDRITALNRLEEVAAEWSYDKMVERQSLQGELEEVLLVEERTASQKAKLRWLKKGHTIQVFSIKFSMVGEYLMLSLKLQGRMIEDEGEIVQHILSFYKNIYTRSEEGAWGVEGLPWYPISSFENGHLEKVFTEEEVKEACDGNKALGPDGFSLAFFQKCWEVVKDDLFRVFQEFYERGIINAITNETFISLIPKKIQSWRVSDFRLISLVTSLYKTIGKVLAKRLMKALPATVEDTHFAFIHGRKILDAALIANEVVKDYRSKKEKALVL